MPQARGASGPSSCIRSRHIKGREPEQSDRGVFPVSSKGRAARRATGGQRSHSWGEQKPLAGMAEVPAPLSRQWAIDSALGEAMIGVLLFPVVGQHDPWMPTDQQVRQWQELYPGVDVAQELRKALAWTVANPTKRKTARGMPRFLVSW